MHSRSRRAREGHRPCQQKNIKRFGVFLQVVSTLVLSGILLVPISEARTSSSAVDPWRDPARCPTVELDAPGGCLDGYPYESQEGTYACYGFTATKLYDCYLASRGLRKAGVHSSAIQATLDFVDVSPLVTNHKSGIICDVLDHLLSNGACRDDLADQALDRKGQYGATIDRLLKLREDYQELLDRERMGGTSSSVRIERRKHRIEEKAQCTLERRVNSPELFHDLEAIVQFLSESAPDVAINELLFGKVCGDQPRLRVSSDSRAICQRVTPSRESWDPADSETLQREQHEIVVSELLRGRAAGLSMCAEALLGTGYGVNWSRNPPSGDSSRCSSHATTVIGSRFYRGRCQLKVFDSTGILSSTQGKAWLDASHLMGNTWGVSFAVESEQGRER